MAQQDVRTQSKHVSGGTIDISTLKRAYPSFSTQKMDYIMSPVKYGAEWEFDYMLL